ncbi:MAG: hypothetical protein AAFP19_26690 [Bacteroidota bacterium]
MMQLELLQDCENLIAKGNVNSAIKQLLLQKEQTKYKKELLSISSRWEKMRHDEMTGLLSSDESQRERSRLSAALLQLLEVLKKETQGEKVLGEDFSLIDERRKKTQPIWPIVLPWLISVVALAFIVFYLPRPADCPKVLRLEGEWELVHMQNDLTQSVGLATITQEACSSYFQVSGILHDRDTSGIQKAKFSSKIGGIHDGEILFIYENFKGEMGLCRGVLPSDKEVTQFEVTFYDIYGYDKDDATSGDMYFRRKK